MCKIFSILLCALMLAASLPLGAAAAETAAAAVDTDSSTAGADVFNGYDITILDAETPAVNVRGRTNDRTVMCFVSADNQEVGVISYSDFNAIIQKNQKVIILPGGGIYGASPVLGKTWEDWFADEFNNLRTLDFGSREEAIASANAVTNENIKKDLISLTNAERQMADMPTLNTDATAMEFAQIRAQEITTHWSHRRPNGGGLTYGNLYFTEIIHKGSDTPQGALNGWMNSDGHRSVLLGDHESYGNRFGVGVVKSESDMDSYWVEVFVLWDPHM